MKKSLFPIALALACASGLAGAHELSAKKGNAKQPAFDIVKTDIRVDAAKNQVEFTMQVAGKAGSVTPKKTGKFAGADVYSYVGRRRSIRRKWASTRARASSRWQ